MRQVCCSSSVFNVSCLESLFLKKNSINYCLLSKHMDSPAGWKNLWEKAGARQWHLDTQSDVISLLVEVVGYCCCRWLGVGFSKVPVNFWKMEFLFRPCGFFLPRAERLFQRTSRATTFLFAPVRSFSTGGWAMLVWFGSSNTRERGRWVCTGILEAVDHLSDWGWNGNQWRGQCGRMNVLLVGPSGRTRSLLLSLHD